MDYASELNQRAWKQQWNIAHYLLLGTVIATVVDLILLLANASFFIPYCAAVPYYLTYFGFFFDGWQVGTYTITGMIMAFVGLAVYLVLWWVTKRHTKWLWAGLALLIVDTLGLAAIALLFMESPLSCLLEFIFHIVVIYEVAVGIRADKRLRQAAAEPAPTEEPWDNDTPTDSEYSDWV